MTWQEHLLQICPHPVMLATATTGLNPHLDNLIAVSVIRPAEQRSELFIHKVPEQDILPSMEYHKFAPSDVMSKGWPTETLKEKLSEVLNGCTCFSYNPEFQQGFLEIVMGEKTPVIYDLPGLLKGAESHMTFKSQDIGNMEQIDRTMTKLGRSPSLRQICQGRNIAPNNIAMFPVEYNSFILNELWYRLEAQPLHISESL